MAISFNYDGTQKYKKNVYSITLDVSGWDRTTIQAVGPVAGTVYVYGSNDGGGSPTVSQGSASLAINFSGIQVKNLATSTAVSSFNAAGLYEVDVNAQFLRVQGGGADIYRLIFNHTKQG